MEELLKSIEEYASVNKVPIMLKDGIEYITKFISDNNIKDVLEIGTAICYSAIKMRLVCNKVTTIERDENRYNEAIKNYKKSGLDNIELIYGDALEVNVEGLYDMILIDAAKGQNLNFINKYINNLKNDGFIIIDNMNFHGLVGNSSEIKSRNLRSLVRKIENFEKWLDSNDMFEVTKVNVGDGLVILKRK